MKSNIVSKLNPKFKPVVIIKTDTEPENITGPKTRIGGVFNGISCKNNY